MTCQKMTERDDMAGLESKYSTYLDLPSPRVCENEETKMSPTKGADIPNNDMSTCSPGKLRRMPLKEAVQLAMEWRRQKEIEDDDIDEFPQNRIFLRRKLTTLHWMSHRDEGMSGSFSLSDIDAYLGRSRPPAIEYFFVEVIVNRNYCHTSHLGRWGHSAIRYTLPTGEQKLVNISRPDKGHELFEFYDDPDDYILGINGKGGIFSRDICSVRLEHVNDDALWAMHHYFLSQSCRFKADGKGVKFRITGGFWTNLFRYVFRMRSRPSGNCARWVSKGMVLANVIKIQSMFPKAIWVEVLEDQSILQPSNVNVVYYKRIKTKANLKPHLKTGFSFTSCKTFFFYPSEIIRTILYWDMSQYANVIVDNSCEIKLEDQIKCLRLDIRSGKSKRLSYGIIMGLKVLHLVVILFAIFFYIFYCPKEGDALNGSCSGTWPQSLGLRIVLVVVVFGITELWLY